MKVPSVEFSEEDSRLTKVFAFIGGGLVLVLVIMLVQAIRLAG